MCNNTQGIWYLSDNMVECTDTHCDQCRIHSLAQRYMSRCGANGFGRHTGLSSEAVWRVMFKVDLPGVCETTSMTDCHVMHLHFAVAAQRE